MFTIINADRQVEAEFSFHESGIRVYHGTEF